MKRFVLIILDGKVRRKGNARKLLCKPVLYTTAQVLIMFCAIASQF